MEKVFKKYENNPVFGSKELGTCFDVYTARICAAISPDGITGWKRFKYNPIVSPEKGTWDADACYKPSFLWNEEEKKWMLWYNGRCDVDEFVGFVTCDQMLEQEDFE